LFADNYSQDLFSQAMLSAASVVRQTVMRTDNYPLTMQSMSTGRRVRDSGLLPSSAEAAKVIRDARERAVTSQDSGHQIVA